MALKGPKYPQEEFTRRGEMFFERDIRSQVQDKDPDDFVAIDIETGTYEVGPDELAVTDRLRERVPSAPNLVKARRLEDYTSLWSPASIDSRQAMITGSVNSHREAIIRLTLQGPSAQGITIQAIIDTGFTGWLTLPPDVIRELDLTWNSQSTATLADGSSTQFDTYYAEVKWNDRHRRIIVDSADVEPLAGMALMDGHELVIEVSPGGRVVIDTIASK